MRKNRCIWGALLAFTVTIGAAPAAQAADALTVVSVTGVTDGTMTTIPADEYVMTFYEMGLLASPTAPAFDLTDNHLDLSSAVKVFESTGGVAVSIQNGVPSSLAGMISRPPDGTYHYAYAVIEPLITLRASARENSATGTARYSTNTFDGTYQCFSAGTVSGVALEQSLTSFDGIAGNDMDNENSVGSGTLYSFLTEAPSGGIYPKGDDTPTKLVGIFKIGGASGVVITSSSTTLNLSMNVSEGAQAVIVGGHIAGFVSAPPSMTFDVR